MKTHRGRYTNFKTQHRLFEIVRSGFEEKLLNCLCTWRTCTHKCKKKTANSLYESCTQTRDFKLVAECHFNTLCL